MFKETNWTVSQVGRKADRQGNGMVHVQLGIMEVFLSGLVYNAALN
jgi:hypothetical protein